MARRSSARLRNRTSTTPQRVSLSHDAPITRTPRTAPSKLFSLDEEDGSDDMPGAFPRSVSPPETHTPVTKIPLKPAHEEMHPQLHYQSTSKPRDEARELGFQSLGAATAPQPARQRIMFAGEALPDTPTRAQKGAEVTSPQFQFTFRREQSLELSPEAKKLMYEKREEAAKIRQQMMGAITEEGGGGGAGVLGEGRSIAGSLKKKGRFSDLHREQFDKMGSIASHASALRHKPSTTTMLPTAGSGTSSVKRSPSKAQLDDVDHTRSAASPHSLHRTPSKSTLGSQLPRAKTVASSAPTDPSPTKRIKRNEVDDVSAHRVEDKNRPVTPLRLHPSNPNLIASITTPTQASLARAVSVKPSTVSKIPAPGLMRSPSKPSLREDAAKAGPATPLLRKSPSKASLFSTASRDVVSEGSGSSLRGRSPVRAPPSTHEVGDIAQAKAGPPPAPLLLRSPLKASVAKPSEAQPTTAPQAPLLSRSPLKNSITNTTHPTTSAVAATPSQPALLSRTPSKIAAFLHPHPSTPSGTGTGKGLLNRFQLLRASPMKSILRSPARLYSDDPAKVAAGTHFATPPKKTSSTEAVEGSAQKRVDFSSSTKARYEDRGSSEIRKVRREEAASSEEEEKTMYPALPSMSEQMDVQVEVLQSTPRRQIIAPTDFTFRAGEQKLVFGASPHAPADFGKNRRATIRGVSHDEAEVATEGIAKKKRKFEGGFEVEDKENADVVGEEEGRPAKRVKAALAEKPRTEKGEEKARLATLGVKAKKSVVAGGAKEGGKEKPKARPSTISQARLAALSQPKKRG